MASTKIIVKAMVAKEKNQIMFVESDADFVDVLLGFLTMPMGSIINLIHDCSPGVGIGCMNNLYKSVESLDQKCFRTRECKSMLLQPKNGAEAEFNSLKVKIYEHRHWYICSATFFCCRSLSRYSGALCACGKPMTIGLVPNENVPKDKAHVDDKGVFVKNSTRHLITDDLQIIPMSQTSTLSLLSRFGAANVGATEERTFSIGVKEVVNLLKCSFASKAPLTETLLKAEKGSNLIKMDQFHGMSQEKEVGKSGDGTVHIKLMVSKSKKVVCYADASEEFVDLLFGFLTVPLGHIFKEMRGAPSKGCAFHLYKSIEDLDAAKCLISDVHKNTLLCPKIAPLFGFEKQLLDVEEALNKKYHCADENSNYTLIEYSYSRSNSYYELTVMDPKSPSKKATKGGGGFLTTPATFTVTDDLIIAPVSPMLCLSILNKMQVPPEDVVEYVVHVGKKEASELLIASFTSETPLTDVFLRDQNKKV